MSQSHFTPLLLDLGSHSAKAYIKGSKLEEVGQVTWRLLEEGDFKNHELEEKIWTTLRSLIEPFKGKHHVSAIGTEAMRRHSNLASIVQKVCESLGVSYRTLSHQEEAHLILKAFENHGGHDLINVGGGSIQIVSALNSEITLIKFGISDLNQKFSLIDEPLARRIEECVSWIEAHLPPLANSFVYTGGEEKYLRHLGVPLKNASCLKTDFMAMSDRLARLTLEELESLSPYDPKWMRGAVASNCIVLACLRQSQTHEFMASNLNIAHGLVESFANEFRNQGSMS